MQIEIVYAQFVEGLLEASDGHLVPVNKNRLVRGVSITSSNQRKLVTLYYFFTLRVERADVEKRVLLHHEFQNPDELAYNADPMVEELVIPSKSGGVSTHEINGHITLADFQLRKSGTYKMVTAVEIGTLKPQTVCVVPLEVVFL